MAISCSFRSGRLIIPVLSILSGCAFPLGEAARSGDKEAISRLLASGADVNEARHGVTPLVESAIGGKNDAVELLIAKGADPNRRAPGGWAPLLAAIFSRHPDTAQLLVNSGAQVNREVIELSSWYTPEISDFLEKVLGGRALTPAQLQEAMASAIARQTVAKKTAPNSDVDTPRYSNPERPADYALVVGIEKYADPDLPEALWAEKDSETVRKHLVALGVPPRNIKMLNGPRATKAQLTAYLEQWLPESVNKESRVFVYFSGHGAPSAESRETYLVPFDGDPDYLSETAYPIKRLFVKLNSLPVQNVVIALDTCFAGVGERSVMPKGLRPLVRQARDEWLLSGGRVVALSASLGYEVSGTIEAQGHGLFTYFLLKGLNGEAESNGHVTTKGLYSYLRPRVGDAASGQNRKQTPQLIPDGAPDFVWR